MHPTSYFNRIFGSVLVALITLSLSSGAFAAGKHRGGHGATHGHGGEAHIGNPGNAADVSRTITVTMTDNRYSPKNIEVKKGETIRFVLKNNSDFVHEFNIGTAKMHKAHQKEMMAMMERGVLEPDRINHAKMEMDMGNGNTMAHNDPNSALLEPNKSGKIVWKFGRSGNLEFACNVPGHYELGMVGIISIR